MTTSTLTGLRERATRFRPIKYMTFRCYRKAVLNVHPPGEGRWNAASSGATLASTSQVRFMGDDGVS